MPRLSHRVQAYSILQVTIRLVGKRILEAFRGQTGFHLDSRRRRRRGRVSSFPSSVSAASARPHVARRSPITAGDDPVAGVASHVMVHHHMMVRLRRRRRRGRSADARGSRIRRRDPGFGRRVLGVRRLVWRGNITGASGLRTD